MFNRPKYKEFAKKMLKGRYGVPILIFIITAIVVNLFTIPVFLGMYNSVAGQDLINGNYSTIEELTELVKEVSDKSYSFPIEMIEMIVSAIFMMASLSVYLKLSRGPEKVSFSTFIEGFNNWWKAALGVLWQYLWIFIWSLLFFIPGIIKAFSYSQMFYIMNEFENVSVTKSMRISIIITKGHKWDIFVMCLSFIGWDILSVFTLGILNLWIGPYKNMTYMNAFHAMMKEALEQGTIKPEDLQ